MKVLGIHFSSFLSFLLIQCNDPPVVRHADIEYAFFKDPGVIHTDDLVYKFFNNKTGD